MSVSFEKLLNLKMLSSLTADCIAVKNGITKEQAQEIYQKSTDLMPILLHQYGADINKICEKIQEYQKILIKNLKNK